jgi:hypothetical protein
MLVAEAAPIVEEPRLKTARRPLWMILLALLFLTVALNLYPIRTGTIRFALTILPLLTIVSGSLLFLRKPHALVVIGAVGIAALLVAIVPGRAADMSALSAAYIESLKRYEGTKYIWGGETNRGIDCSGLIRCGLMDAGLREGITGLNPALVRQSAQLWWGDASAQELLNGYGGRTRVLIPKTTINSIDHSQLRPGDFAVTINGVHTLAYLGDKTWIEADPGEGRVIIVRIPTSNPWFNHSVAILHWQMLD